jgi:uncharacterized protein (TIGR00369 family)
MSALAPDVVTAIEKLIVGSPYGAHLGLVCEGVEADRVRVRMPFRSDLTTIGEMVHGGAIASLVDVAATAAFWAQPEASLDARGSTVGLTLSYLAPGLGCGLVADARVVKRGGSIHTGEVVVADGRGGEVARALVTYKLSRARAA